jgi:hypothetical protein
VCYPCAATSSLPDSQNALQEKGAIPLLSCMQAAVMIHRMLQGSGCAILRCHASSLLLDSECSGARKVCYPCAAVAPVHQNVWWKKGVLSLRCHASSPVAMIHRMLWWKKCAIPAPPCTAVVIHRMLWKKGVLSLRCHACAS